MQRIQHQIQRRALIIAHEPDVPGGHVTVRLRERGYIVDEHLVTADFDEPNIASPYPDASGYDVIAIMGSFRSVTRPEEISSWIETELDLIRAAKAADQPVLGVCFGAQLIAEALGGSVEESPVTEIGWYELDPIPGRENPVGPGPWLVWHHDRFAPPPEAQVLATTEVGPQLFTIGRIAATQFHPEIDVDLVKGWLDNADDAYRAAYLPDPAALLDEVRDHEAQAIKRCKALVDWFLDDVAFPENSAA